VLIDFVRRFDHEDSAPSLCKTLQEAMCAPVTVSLWQRRDSSSENDRCLRTLYELFISASPDVEWMKNSASWRWDCLYVPLLEWLSSRYASKFHDECVY
jgi:hypothetical protein